MRILTTHQMQRLPEGTLAPYCPYLVKRHPNSNPHYLCVDIELPGGGLSLIMKSEIFTRRKFFDFLEDIQLFGRAELQLMADGRALLYDADHPGWITYYSRHWPYRINIEFCQELLDALDELAR